MIIKKIFCSIHTAITHFCCTTSTTHSYSLHIMSIKHHQFTHKLHIPKSSLTNYSFLPCLMEFNQFMPTESECALDKIYAY